MINLSALAITIHALGAVVWVGGMLFAYTVLRPSLGSFEPAQRLTLWSKVFSRFFVWVWVAIIALPLSGYILMFDYHGGFAAAGLHIHIMHALGLVMIGLFLFLYFFPYRQFSDAVAQENWPQSATHLNAIRRIVGINTMLGLLTVIIGASGRFWS